METPSRKTIREAAIGSDTVVTAADGFIARKVADETVIMDARQGEFFGLDEIGSSIWEHLQRPIAVGRLCERLMVEYDVPLKRCEQEVVRLLNEMADRGLVRIAESEG